MVNRLIFIATAAVIALELMAFSAVERSKTYPGGNAAEAVMATAMADDYSACVVKVGSEWGSKIGTCAEYEGYKAKFDDTYRVDLKNNCEQTLDIMVAVQEEDKSWNCKTVTSIAQNVEFSHYACKGVGKYLWWTKLAGDESIVFPSAEEVNKQYPE